MVFAELSKCRRSVTLIEAGKRMCAVDCLLNSQFVQLKKRAFDWTFEFAGAVCLTAECPWRLLEGGKICVTSEDDGHQFGLPTPVNSAELVNIRLSAATVNAVQMREGTLDLSIAFSSGHIVELLAVSSGYEAWNLAKNALRIIACGGGTLAVADDDPRA